MSTFNTFANRIEFGNAGIIFRNSPVTPVGTLRTFTPAAIITNAGDVGIGTTTPTAKLEVDGASNSTIKIVDGNQGTGKVLTSDATGQGSWQTPTGGYRQTFALQGAQTYNILANTVMNFPAVSIPYTGYYLINFKSFFNVTTAGEYSYYINVILNGVTYSTTETYVYCDTNFYLNVTDVYTLQANAGDALTLSIGMLKNLVF